VANAKEKNNTSAMTIEKFIQSFQSYAKEVEAIYKIPYLVTMAQAALESGWGKSMPGNMVFGMKAGSNYTGQKQLIRTTEYHKTNTVKYPKVESIEQLPNGNYKYIVYDWFRKYDSPLDSFKDYGSQLSKVERYKPAFKTADPFLFAAEIAKAGYATDPSYLTKITSIINSIKKKALLITA
jgi:flagellum-specific peptidoglycan hydrolase FlgJ